jgi:FAD-linked sulfhydryl oxidase
MPPPPDPDMIGRAGWTILHTTAAAFPNRPTSEQQRDFKDFIRTWSKLYPCNVCAYHMRRDLENREIVATNKREASRFVCELHNSVNRILDKPVVSCDPDEVLRRWHPGYPHDMDDEPPLEEQIAAARAGAAAAAGGTRRRTTADAPPPRQPQAAPPAAPAARASRWSIFGGAPTPTSSAPTAPPTTSVSLHPPSSINPARVADDETDPAAVLARLKGCHTWCPDKSLDAVLNAEAKR